MRLLLLFSIFLVFNSCGEDQTQVINDLQQAYNESQAQLAYAEEQAAYTPGLIHSVFFWLNEDISEEDHTAFLEGVNSLREVGSIRRCYIGPPAPTEERGVVDNSYSYALLVHFDDVAGHDAYQIDPIHLKFVEDHKDKWTKVVVYDNTLQEAPKE